MKPDEMITILEEIARDEDKPERTLYRGPDVRQIMQDRAGGRSDEAR